MKYVNKYACAYTYEFRFSEITDVRTKGES
jgi:hypothetical protein